MSLSPDDVLHTPPLTRWATEDGLHIALDSEGPNWLATDARGAKLLELIDGRRTLSEVVRLAALSPHPVTAFQHAWDFLAAAHRAGLVATEALRRAAYTGRATHLEGFRLRELWLHTNDACNLRCAHCLVSSGPDGGTGLPTEALLDVVEQAVALGVERVFITGGEPFVRRDLPALVERVTGAHRLELVILTNGTLLTQERHRAALEGFDRARVRFQVSLDGATAEANDALRGPGTFEKASAGLRLLASMGFETSLTATPSRSNLDGLVGMPALARSLGASAFHLMWPHRRGRALGMLGEVPSVDALIALSRAIAAAARQVGVRFDNLDALEGRVNAVAGVKHDLGMAGVESLCVAADGTVYPSAATANHGELAMGRVGQGASLLEVWRASPLTSELRQLSLVRSPSAREEPLRFLTGGGDVEHAYFWSGRFDGADPWAPVSVALARDAMEALARRGRARFHADARGGAGAPVVFHAMGEGGLACGDEAPGTVRTLHSNCVLAFDVERPRALVQAFYGAAAETPDESLCCPVRPSAEDLQHIPKDVVDRFYGCGSPVADAKLAKGETVVDLGSGAGIDVFIAAKHVGRTGRAIGVDMTDTMLAVAAENKGIVAANLGYDVAEFRRGYLERVPVEDEQVDCVTSNCVVNLSADKRAVFQEVWRVLKPHGRVVLSDIVVDRSVPPHFRVNPHLWGECLSGALTEAELYAELERAGFYGVERLRRSHWKTVEGLVFSSVTVRAYKPASTGVGARASGGVPGFRAVYGGPFKGVSDEAGRFFLRDVPVAVTAEVAAGLLRPPYAPHFLVWGPDGAEVPLAGQEKPKVSCCG